MAKEYIPRNQHETCGGKLCYDKKGATSAINLRTKGRRRNRHNRPTRLRAYACPDCGHWHITHRV